MACLLCAALSALSAVSPHSGAWKPRGAGCLWGGLVFAVQTGIPCPRKQGQGFCFLTCARLSCYCTVLVVCVRCGRDTGWLAAARVDQTFSQFLFPKPLFCGGPNILWLRVPLKEDGWRGIVSCTLAAAGIKGNKKAPRGEEE